MKKLSNSDIMNGLDEKLKHLELSQREDLIYYDVERQTH